jgi:hypothetical protein
LSVNPFDPRVSRQDDEAIAPPDESTWGKGKKKKKKKVSPGINTSAVVPGCGAGFRGDGKNRKIKIVKCKATSKRRAEKKKRKKKGRKRRKKKGGEKRKEDKKEGRKKRSNERQRGEGGGGEGAKGRRVGGRGSGAEYARATRVFDTFPRARNDLCETDGARPGRWNGMHGNIWIPVDDT